MKTLADAIIDLLTETEIRSIEFSVERDMIKIRVQDHEAHFSGVHMVHPVIKEQGPWALKQAVLGLKEFKKRHPKPK